MIKKEGKTPMKGMNNAYLVETQYDHEPISNNIGSSIDDYYNLMHLIKKSWTNEKYSLRVKGAGFDIYDEDKKFTAWIGIKEKCSRILFILHSSGKLYAKTYKDFQGEISVWDFNEDLWVYSNLPLDDIIKEASFENQKEIISNWLDKDINKIL